MDFGTGREGEEQMYALIQEGGSGDGGEGDSFEFLNESGLGMEVERPHEAQTRIDCDDGSQEIGPALMKFSEVY
jgi:hypothetical protein